MNIKIDIDITPEEFRKLMGWPDMQAFQQDLMEKVREQMNTGAEGYDPLSLFKVFLPQSTASIEAFQKLMMGFVGGHAGDGNKGD
jgi:hypothetical protein